MDDSGLLAVIAIALALAFSVGAVIKALAQENRQLKTLGKTPLHSYDPNIRPGTRQTVVVTMQSWNGTRTIHTTVHGTTLGWGAIQEAVDTIIDDLMDKEYIEFTTPNGDKIIWDEAKLSEAELTNAITSVEIVERWWEQD